MSSRLLGLVAAFTLAGAAWAVDESMLEARAEFAEALARIGHDSGLDAGADSTILQQYPLYPYLAAARLAQRRPSAELDSEIRGFLAIHAGEPVAFPLHRAWLASLVERESWRALVDHYASTVASTETECQYLRARVNLAETDGLAELVAARWLTPTRLPSSCEPAFQWLRDTGQLGPAQTEARVRALLDAGEHEFARIIARRLPSPQAQRYMQWAEMLGDPLSAIDRVVESRSGIADEEALLAAWRAGARDDPREAAARFEALRRVLAPDDATVSRFALALALGLAWDRQPDTLRLFGRVAERDLDDYALGWLARAALWAHEWASAERSISMMSPAQRETSSWRFWRGRSLEALHDTDRARDIYRSILDADNFYSAMAAARLRSRLEPNVMAIDRSPEVLRSLESWPAIMRARELFALGHRIDATREWRHAMQFLSSAEKEQAMILAHDWGWYDVAVSTATEVGVFNHYEVLYPLPFGGEIASAARATRVADEVIYGLIRQESLFRPDAVSPAGAMGLTQILPTTARRTARDRQDEGLDTASLLTPAINIQLGAATLRSLLDRYAGQLVVALAAYNAGPGAADRWLPATTQPADIWIENIPFNETRDYVQRVIWHSLVFGWRQSGRPQDPSHWLEAVRRPGN